MDYEETMVENEDFDTEADDTLPEGIEEEDMSEEEDLSEALNEEETEQPEPQPASGEPGYVKRRVEKAVQQALARERESIRAEMEAQYAPIRKRFYEMEAQDLLNSGKVKDIDTARELVGYRHGVVPEQAEPQPRNEQGQFASRNDPTTDPGVSARVDMLAHQAKAIAKETGLDVIDVFSEDPDIRQAVMDGEMDFYDLAKTMKSRKRPPAPMRSPNGAIGANPNAIESMSAEQFARLEKRIDGGARISLK